MKNKEGYYIRNDIIYVQGSIDNEFKRYSSGKKNTKANLTWIKKNHRDVLLKLHSKKTGNTSILDDKFNKFAELSLELNKPTRADSTNEEYQMVYNNYIKEQFKSFSLSQIKKADLLKWQNDLLEGVLSTNRIRFIRSVFSGILNDAVENDLIEKNPWETISQPKRANDEEKELYPFSLLEIEKILAASTGQAKNILTVLFFTGMRTGECWGLKWSDINFHNETIHIQRKIRHGKIGPLKTKKSKRMIVMLPLVKEVLRNQKAYTIMQDDFVFLNDRGTFFKNAQSFSDGIWKRTLKFCQLDYRLLRQTRHTFASMMISEGEDILWVSKTLGHADLFITTTVYSKYIPDKTKERAQFLKNFNKKNCTNTAQSFLSLSKGSNLGAL